MDVNPSTGDAVLATDYATGVLSKDTPEERERLRLLQEWGDPDTRDVLAAAGIHARSRCVELGAGAGSVARWMADRCPQGHVLAVDSDTRYLADTDRDNLEWRRADVRELDLPAASVDLVHSRLTLCHVPEREAVLADAARWLAPSGALAVGDVLCVPAATSVHPPVRRFFGALEAVWHAQGSDMSTWARTLPAQLARAGLHGVAVRTRANCLGDDGPYGALAAANIRQEGAYLVERGLLAAEDVAEVLELCERPDFRDLRSITVYAWGRRPDGRS